VLSLLKGLCIPPEVMSSDWPLSRFRFSLDDNHKLRNCVLSAPSPPTELKARIPTAPITSAAYCKICNTKLVFRSPDTFPDICQLAFAGWSKMPPTLNPMQSPSQRRKALGKRHGLVQVRNPCLPSHSVIVSCRVRSFVTVTAL